MAIISKLVYKGLKDNLPASRSADSFYLCTDTRELYFGADLYTDPVRFYTGTKPTAPAQGVLYIEETTGAGDVWNGTVWGCGSGSKGSCNNGWIQFEICEDNLSDPVYFEKVYREAVELTAYLCKLYNLDPQGTVTYCGVKVPVILCHRDSYNLGLGSAHSDVLHWFPKYGKSMQTVRDDVSALLAGANFNTEEDEDMDAARFKELFSDMRKDWQDNDCGDWSKNARDWATSTGLIAGGGKMPDGTPNYMWADMLTREQAAALFYRFAQMMGKV